MTPVRFAWCVKCDKAVCELPKGIVQPSIDAFRLYPTGVLTWCSKCGMIGFMSVLVLRVGRTAALALRSM